MFLLDNIAWMGLYEKLGTSALLSISGKKEVEFHNLNNIRKVLDWMLQVALLYLLIYFFGIMLKKNYWFDIF